MVDKRCCGNILSKADGCTPPPQFTQDVINPFTVVAAFALTLELMDLAPCLTLCSLECDGTLR